MRCEVCGLRCELRAEESAEIMLAKYAGIICRHNEKARMHIVHSSFLILQLTESVEISELKDENARMHNVHSGFLSFSAEMSELQDEKASMHIVHPSFFHPPALKSVSA